MSISSGMEGFTSAARSRAEVPAPRRSLVAYSQIPSAMSVYPSWPGSMATVCSQDTALRLSSASVSCRPTSLRMDAVAKRTACRFGRSTFEARLDRSDAQVVSLCRLLVDGVCSYLFCPPQPTAVA